MGHEITSCYLLIGFPEWWEKNSSGNNVTGHRGGRGGNRGSRERSSASRHFVANFDRDSSGSTAGVFQRTVHSLVEFAQQYALLIKCEDPRMNLFKGGAVDVVWKSQASMELKLGPMTRARMKKLKASNRNEDNGMDYMEEASKNKFEEFEGQGKASKVSATLTVADRLLDMNRKSPSWMEVKLGPITRAQRNKLKLQEDNGMLAYIMEALKSKVHEFEDQGKHPKASATVAGRTLPALLGLGNLPSTDDESMELNCSSQFLLLIDSRVCVLDSIDFRSSILCDWGFENLHELVSSVFDSSFVSYGHFSVRVSSSPVS
ncbi:hypothetical protein M9H77_12755 [Catharanthus roseus]|uniref:Uncharacterized protein n=1 Tax=Catharanthus roseus TaxID=4058 RepID=A0ACC0BIA1_CATRO|nr:hypothetical protein M9H77_12755 [Catharanthus roseus]